MAVEVKFSGSAVVAGRLRHVDPSTMNMVLEEAVEMVDGNPKTRFGLVVLRGSAVSLVRVIG